MVWGGGETLLGSLGCMVWYWHGREVKPDWKISLSGKKTGGVGWPVDVTLLGGLGVT